MKNLKLIALLSVIVLLLNTVFLKNPAVGVVGIILYFVSLGLLIGERLDTQGSGLERLLWGALSLLLIEIILNTIMYYTYGARQATVIITLLIPLVTLPFLREFRLSSISYLLSVSFKAAILPLVSILLDLVLLYFLYTHRTLDLLPSPWMTFDYKFFLLYGLATTVVFIAVYRSNKIWMQIFLTSTHLFITYAVIVVLYPLGFGYDGFIHRATELWIYEHGFITPKQPFYIGQYSLIVWLSHLTHIKTFYIDLYFVPLLSALTLPPTVIYTLKKVWDIPSRIGAFGVWLIPFIFFLSLQITTPHNVVILFMMITVFAILAYLHNQLAPIIPILLAVASLATHPLLGAPLALFVFTAIVIRKLPVTCYPLRVTILFYTILSALTVPLLFTAHLLMSGHGIPAFVNPIHQFGHFLALFKRPYWYAPHSPFIFEMLYHWQQLIPAVVIILGLIGVHISRNTYHATQENQSEITRYPLPVTRYLFLASFLGFILGAYLLRSWIVFPDVAALEQGDYPLRLLKTSLIFLLPFAMFATHKFISYFLSHISQKIYYPLLVTGYALLLMFSFYLAYPQRNPKVYFPGFNITRADFHAVEWIHHDNAEYNYIVLSNPVVAMAALTDYSFVKDYDTPKGKVFYYSIPSGAPMYKLYERMLYEGQKREYMEEAMNAVDVKKAYFVVNNYWSNFPKIVEGAKKTADSFYEVDGGKVMIFTYKNTP